MTVIMNYPRADSLCLFVELVFLNAFMVNNSAIFCKLQIIHRFLNSKSLSQDSLESRSPESRNIFDLLVTISLNPPLYSSSTFSASLAGGSAAGRGAAGAGLGRSVILTHSPVMTKFLASPVKYSSSSFLKKGSSSLVEQIVRSVVLQRML